MAGVMSSEDIAKSAEKGRWKDVAIEQKGLTRLSGAAGDRLRMHRPTEGRQPYRALVSSGYVKRADGWKLAFHQQTALRAKWSRAHPLVMPGLIRAIHHSS